MADIVNPQITDAVTQTNLADVGQAPALAAANLYLTVSQALGNAAHNATVAQQNGSMTAQAATVQGIALLYGFRPTTAS